MVNILTCARYKFNLIWKTLYRSSRTHSLLAISCELLHNSYMAAIKGAPFDMQVVISLGSFFLQKITISPLDWSRSDWSFFVWLFVCLFVFFLRVVKFFSLNDGWSLFVCLFVCLFVLFCFFLQKIPMPPPNIIWCAPYSEVAKIREYWAWKCH